MKQKTLLILSILFIVYGIVSGIYTEGFEIFDSIIFATLGFISLFIWFVEYLEKLKKK
jgi:hypothetical protein